MVLFVDNLSCRYVEYKSREYNISVRFPALQSAIITATKLKNDALDEALDEALESRIIAMLRVDPQLTQQDLVSQLDGSRSSVQRSMKKLVDTGKIVRIGGKRFGHWEIQD